MQDSTRHIKYTLWPTEGLKAVTQWLSGAMPVLHHRGDSFDLKGVLTDWKARFQTARGFRAGEGVRGKGGDGRRGEWGQVVNRTKAPGDERVWGWWMGWWGHIYGFHRNRGKMRRLLFIVPLPCCYQQGSSYHRKWCSWFCTKIVSLSPLPTCYCQFHYHIIILDA